MKDSYLSERMNAASKASYDHDARIHEKPVTKAEQEAREAIRDKPKVQNILTPEGHTVQTVNTEVSAENERRINFIKKRLGRQQHRLTREFNDSRSR